MDNPLDTPSAPIEWADSDRQRMAAAAHDIANMVAAGLKPKPADLVTFRWLQHRRDTWLGKKPDPDDCTCRKVADYAPGDPLPHLTITQADPYCIVHGNEPK